jgi:sugar phosphate isomerase/epimerase
MQLKLVKSIWGMTGTLEQNLRQIAEAGYAAVEMQLPPVEQLDQFKRLLRELELELVAMVITQTDDHLAEFKTKVEQARALEPLQLTVHAGKDWWSWERQKEFFAQALEVERRTGLIINHETHRGRPMFTPAATARLLREFPELRINADFSHFCNVCESLLEDQQEDLNLCIARARHVHGRVGHEEGPQVNDPRAPEWARQLAAHEAWWSAIIRARRQTGAAFFTFNPEFGPPNYMPTLPYTYQPVSDLWDICCWMAQRFERLYHEVADSR